MSVDEPTLGSEIVDRAGDVLIQRGERLYVVRRAKRWQAFVPKSLMGGIGLWDLFFTLVFNLMRAVPPLFSSQWQVGVFWVRNAKDPGSKHTMVLKEFVSDLEAASQRQDELVRHVNSGQFD